MSSKNAPIVGSREWLDQIICLFPDLLGIELYHQKPQVVFFVPMTNKSLPEELHSIVGYRCGVPWIRGNHKTVLAVVFEICPPFAMPSAKLVERRANVLGFQRREHIAFSIQYLGYYAESLYQKEAFPTDLQ